VEKDVSNAILRRGVELPALVGDVVERSAKLLRSSGFQIVHKRAEEVEDAHSPVVIDKKNKVATVIDDYARSEEAIEVPAHGGVKIRYGVFEGQRKLMEPARLADDGAIELNISYPIFLGKAKGEILRRIHVLLFLAKKECKSADEMYDYLVRRIREEFE
jgi:hypothetical protein